jgi:hypothetical protein
MLLESSTQDSWLRKATWRSQHRTRRRGQSFDARRSARSSDRFGLPGSHVAVSYNVAAAEEHRATLFLDVPFTQVELRAAYRKLIWQWHPDRNLSAPEVHAQAVHKAMLINVAYEFLSEYLEANAGVYQGAATRPPSTPSGRCSWSDLQPERKYEGKKYRAGFRDPSVTEIFLKSSHIVSTGYNPSSQILYIKFTGNNVYKYHDVPQSIYEAFLAAPSHGKFANKNIYRHFKFHRW